MNRSEGWLDLSDRYFVLLGAGAAMGPLEVLLALGANVIAVDLNREQIWRRLITLARSSWGSLTFPLEHGAKATSLSDDELFAKAGCNLFTQTPEIRNWLLTVHPGKHLTVGGYAYIPGDLFPRVALAMDVIIEALSEQRGASVAFLCTPTDCHLVPPAATAAAKDNLRKSPTWQKVRGVIIVRSSHSSVITSMRMCVPSMRVLKGLRRVEWRQVLHPLGQCVVRTLPRCGRDAAEVWPR